MDLSWQKFRSKAFVGVYLYDANGNLTNMWSGTIGGVTNVYQYDVLNRLTSVKGDGGTIASYGFDAVGNLQVGNFGNDVTNLYQYDRLNRLTNAVWSSGTTQLASFYYQLGLTGNRTNLNETIHGTNHLHTWRYDQLYRLTNENINSVNVGYGMDAVGNRLSRTNNLTVDQTFAYNTNDWLLSDTNDSNGNTTYSGTTAYQYDVENHLTNFGLVAFGYDGDGVRVSKTVGSTTTYYLVDDRNPTGYAQVVEEWTASGGSPALTMVYNYGLSLIDQRVPGSNPDYFIFDGHGSTRILTDDTGTVINAFFYDAYGNMVASNTTPQTVYLYCGEQWDVNLLQYYLRARTYNPVTGRFWTMDTYEGDSEDPKSLHKYLYCAANPLNNIDPGGQDLSEQLSVSGIQGILNSGLGTLNTIVKVYEEVKQAQNIYEFATTVSKFISALGQPTPEATEAALSTEFQNLTGTSSGELISGWQEAIKQVGSHWPDIAKAIAAKAPLIAEQAAARISRRIPAYAAAELQGRLKFVIFTPSGPGPRSNDHYINFGSQAQVAVAALGGRLFGFGIRTSKANVDQVFRIDYWDLRTPLNPLKVHYHLIDDPSHPPGRQIWP
jgi:RHS repeat-associated protein